MAFNPVKIQINDSLYGYGYNLDSDSDKVILFFGWSMYIAYNTVGMYAGNFDCPFLSVDYYGTQTPLQSCANVSVPEPRMIQIQPWEASLVKAIEKAILASDVGITPTNDGKVVRLVFPELTEERRKELAKDIKKKGEGAKVAVRNIRRDANDSFKKLAKSPDISEDEIKELEEDVQKLTDSYVKKIDEAVAVKSKEILTV